MKHFATLLLLLTLVSCLNPDCESLANDERNRDCIIVISEVENPTPSNFKVIGIDPKTGKSCECETANRRWGIYSEFMEEGDTIVKRKGELTFNIHKKDTILSFDWTCEGKVYK